MAQTLVKGGYLLDTERPLERGDLLIEDGQIQQVGGEVHAPEAHVIEAGGKIVMPGLVNAHTHSSQAIEKGLSDRLPLDAWMVLASYGGGERPLGPRELYVSTMVGAVEMLQTGTTSVLDAPFPPPGWFDEGMDAIMQAYADIGMRATVAAHYADLDFLSSIPLGLLENGEVAARPPRITVAKALEQAESFVGRWRNGSPRLQPMLGPSSLPRCSIELFEASADLARRLDVRLQTHLLSAKSQVLVGQERFAGSTVKFLEGIGCLAPWASFAHAIWVDEEEIELMASSGCVVVHNPVSNLKLGAGIAPVPAMLHAGVNVALGTDGASSNDSQNMFETLKAAAVLHRIAGPPEAWPGAEDSLRMCWLGGRRGHGPAGGTVGAGPPGRPHTAEHPRALRGPQGAAPATARLQRAGLLGRHRAGGRQRGGPGGPRGHRGHGGPPPGGPGASVAYVVRPAQAARAVRGGPADARAARARGGRPGPALRQDLRVMRTSEGHRGGTADAS